MEHAEHIAEAVSYTKDTFLQIGGIITWGKLFLAVLIPLAAGFALATILLQFVVKPVLVTTLVTPYLGFTEDGIAYMLQYLAVLTALLFLFLFPYYQGFLCRSMQTREVLRPKSFRRLLGAGWKVNLLILYYAIPLIVIMLLYGILFSFVNGALGSGLSGDWVQIADLIDYAALAGYLILEFVTFIFLSLFACIGLVHLARTGSLKEAVNMGRIAEIIKKIGWYDYLLCIVIITIILLTILVFFSGLASLFGYNPAANTVLFLLMILVIIPAGVFITRYLTNIYETAFLEPEEDIEEFDDF